MPRKYNHSGTQKYQAAAFSWTYRTVFCGQYKGSGPANGGTNSGYPVCSLDVCEYGSSESLC